ncbi:MAG TPA: hypothetical protein VGP57_02680 [Actinoplanes sp.]|nr:hypothetical protein [Actinoplanes sp.]
MRSGRRLRPAALTAATHRDRRPPGAAISAGFNGTWTDSSPVPTSFTLNGAGRTTD